MSGCSLSLCCFQPCILLTYTRFLLVSTSAVAILYQSLVVLFDLSNLSSSVESYIE